MLRTVRVPVSGERLAQGGFAGGFKMGVVKGRWRYEPFFNRLAAGTSAEMEEMKTS